MRIRTQTILGITPIFTVLGVAISLLVYTTERAEVVWGIEKEVSALAISIAEFLNENRSSVESEDLGTKSVADRLNAIFEFEQLKRVRFFRLEESGPELRWDRGDENYDPSRDPGQKESRLVLARGIWIEPVDTSVTGLPIARSAAPVMDAEGNLTGMLEAITDSSRLETKTKRIIRRCATITAALTVIGFLLSLGISNFLTRRLRRLDRATRVVAQGDYNQKIDLRTIQEVNDLGSTFNTMSSIIRDTITKAKTQLVESDQFRNPVDLAETCWKLNQENQEFRTGNGDVLIGTAGKTPSGSFAGLEKNGDTMHGVIGAINEGDPLEASVKACAALAYLFRLLKGGQSPEASLKVAGEVFDFTSCRIFQYQGGGSMEYREWSPDRIEKKAIDLERELPAVFSTASTNSTGKIRRMIESTGRTTHRDLELLMSEEPVAAYFIVQRTGD